MPYPNDVSLIEPNWIALWRQLVNAREARRQKSKAAAGPDPWHDRADQFQRTVSARWKNTDSSRKYILSQIYPEATLLDIGAGSGAWAVMLAKHARLVTAVEESPAMLTTMRSNLAQSNGSNICVIEGRWPDIKIQAHDFSLCSHAMYGAADLLSFIRAISQVTRHKCFLVIRVITPQSVLAEASKHIFGHIHYRPHFQIFYNALQQMGVHAHVIMEDTGLNFPWENRSQEEAVEKMKQQLRIEGETHYDRFLIELAERRLVQRRGVYVWPSDVRSALVTWSPKESRTGKD